MKPDLKYLLCNLIFNIKGVTSLDFSCAKNFSSDSIVYSKKLEGRSFAADFRPPARIVFFILFYFINIDRTCTTDLPG